MKEYNIKITIGSGVRAECPELGPQEDPQFVANTTNTPDDVYFVTEILLRKIKRHIENEDAAT